MPKKGAPEAGTVKEWERMNTHETVCVEQEVMGHHFRLSQDPNSQHLGTTVWDASIVLAKWLERHQRKGDFSRTKVKGKKCIELGAGMGLGGMAFHLLGGDVVLTDVESVLPLLAANSKNNLGKEAPEVKELDWMKPEQVDGFSPPYDYVLAADCIYHEDICVHFHKIVMMITNEKSQVVVVNELRSHSVQARFMELFQETHVIKKIPLSKMDETYQHENILIFVMKKKKVAATKDEHEGEEEGEAEAEGEAEQVTDNLSQLKV